jgi:hypothetical protein
MLTAPGATQAQALAAAGRAANRPDVRRIHARPRTPHYDSAVRTLYFAGQVVKRFRRPSLVQELILAAFEEENWPTHIDDPLPPVSDANPKKRLSDAVFRLNGRQVNRLIRFESNGEGSGVIWGRIDGRSTGDRR